jgi:glycosyltransferase involved in cell wall biosynthesis
MKHPLVSVIVPTKNSAYFLKDCLISIKSQTYENTEIIVVDNFSSDNTAYIARKYANKFYSKGPERTAQRNFAAKKASGKYFLFVDSDMELRPKVIEQCMEAIDSFKDVKGIVIHEESFGEGFWAKCKSLERDFYVNIPWIEAARFVSAETFNKIGGYNINLVSGEDWDLSNKVKRLGRILSIDEFILHNEGSVKLNKLMKKKYYYARHAISYLSQNPEESILNSDVGPINRYRLFFSQPKKLFKDPVLGISMIFMKTCEFASGAVGYIIAKANSV